MITERIASNCEIISERERLSERRTA